MVTAHALLHPLSMLLRSPDDEYEYDYDYAHNNHELQGSFRHLPVSHLVDWQQQQHAHHPLGFDPANVQYKFMGGSGGGGSTSSSSDSSSVRRNASRSDAVMQQGIPKQQQQKSTGPARPGQAREMVVLGGQNKKRRRDASPPENVNNNDNTTSTSTVNPPSNDSHVINRVPPAKERRRTQMRLAQRAYRQRKQNELSTTQKRLSEISDAVTDFGTAYNDISSKLTASGFLPLWPDLAQNLHEATAKFQTLVQLSSLADDEPGGHSDHKSSASPPPAQGPSMATSTNQDSLGMLLPPSSGADSTSPGLEPGFAVPKVEDDSTTAFTMSSSNMLFYPQAMPSYGSQATLATNTSGVPVQNNSVAPLPAPTYLSPPTSYSYQETSFARRLHRKCVESAYQVLTSDRAHPAKMARIFKLAFRVWGKKHLVEKFHKKVLGWELDDPSTPSFSVGGAGTHYPRMWNQPVQPVTNGPWPMHMAHIQHQGPDMSIEGIVRSLGMDDGDWFDSQDVEGHLRGMGIYLEAHTTYAEFMQGNVPAVLNVEQFVDRIMSKAVCLGRSPGFRKRDVEEEFFRSIES